MNNSEWWRIRCSGNVYLLSGRFDGSFHLDNFVCIPSSWVCWIFLLWVRMEPGKIQTCAQPGGTIGTTFNSTGFLILFSGVSPIPSNGS
jgi:hypothetical protein